jgi:hypothetical protein
MSFSYKTKAGATAATAEQQFLEAAQRAALIDAELQVSCDNGSCLKRLSTLTAFNMTTSVERGFWGWWISFFGGKGWRAVAKFSFTADVWCEGSPDSASPSS